MYSKYVCDVANDNAKCVSRRTPLPSNVKNAASEPPDAGRLIAEEPSAPEPTKADGIHGLLAAALDTVVKSSRVGLQAYSINSCSPVVDIPCGDISIVDVRANEWQIQLQPGTGFAVSDRTGVSKTTRDATPGLRSDEDLSKYRLAELENPRPAHRKRREAWP